MNLFGCIPIFCKKLQKKNVQYISFNSSKNIIKISVLKLILCYAQKFLDEILLNVIFDIE